MFIKKWLSFLRGKAAHKLDQNQDKENENNGKKSGIGMIEMNKMTDDILAACVVTDAVGTSRRIRHKIRKDGTECTREDQDAAMIVTRTLTGWSFHCFRCNYNGRKYNSTVSPIEIIKMSETSAPKPSMVSSCTVSLPSDVSNIFDRDDCPAIPRAKLMQYRINSDLAAKHGVKYSKAYRRIIFPIYNTDVCTFMRGEHPSFDKDEDKNKVVGWTGRNPYHVSGSVEPKWLVRKSRDFPKPVYHLQGTTDAEIRYCVVVEDTISAIRIYEALDRRVDVIALLCHFMPTSLIMAIKQVLKARIILWMDHDAMKDTLNFWKLCNSLDVRTKYINSTFDPKAYDDEKIIELFNRSKYEHEKGCCEDYRRAI